MIFQETHQQVQDGSKTQTRRPCKPGEYALWSLDDPTKIFSVIGANGRLKWQVGRDYAIQPGRGKKSIGRTPPIVAIRRERLQEISLKDLQAEMGLPGVGYILVFFFIELWNSLYRKPRRWGDDPDVWVLDWGKNGGARQCGTTARR